MKIVISAPVRAFDRATESLVEEADRLASLDGLLFSEDSCGEYLEESLYEIGIVGGQISLSYRPDESELRVVTSYHAPRKLKKAEVQELVRDTTAQWTDGIGEGEFLHAEETGLDVDISAFDGEPTVEQFDDGVKVRKPRKSELVKLLGGRDIDEEEAIALVKRGAAIDAKDRYGYTVLELACRAVLPDLVELLLNRGALERAEHPGRALSRLVFCYGPDKVLQKSVRIARALLERGVDVDVVDDEGRTPLMMAANRKNLPLVELLLEAGADVNRQEENPDNRQSVLMYAQSPEVVAYLLERGADPRILTAYGKNALEVQRQNSHQRKSKEMADIIRRHMEATE